MFWIPAKTAACILLSYIYIGKPLRLWLKKLQRLWFEILQKLRLMCFGFLKDCSLCFCWITFLFILRNHKNFVLRYRKACAQKGYFYYLYYCLIIDFMWSTLSSNYCMKCGQNVSSKNTFLWVLQRRVTGVSLALPSYVLLLNLHHSCKDACKNVLQKNVLAFSVFFGLINSHYVQMKCTRVWLGPG